MSNGAFTYMNGLPQELIELKKERKLITERIEQTKYDSKLPTEEKDRKVGLLKAQLQELDLKKKQIKLNYKLGGRQNQAQEFVEAKTEKKLLKQRIDEVKYDPKLPAEEKDRKIGILNTQLRELKQKKKQMKENMKQKH